MADMKLGEAIAIFNDIETDLYSDEEKGMAILRVCQMETHNSITKSMMLRVIWWLMKLVYELPEDSEPLDWRG